MSCSVEPKPIDQLFHNIIQTARKLVTEDAPLDTTRLSTSSSPSSTRTIQLTLPSSVYPKLITLGLDPRLAHEVSQGYIRHAMELRRASEATFNRACLDIANVNSERNSASNCVERIQAVSKTLYLRKLRSWETEAMDLARMHIAGKKKTTLEPKSVPRCRSTFNPVRSVTLSDVLFINKNQEYVPFLEKYFEHNAYPSATDRAVLARKSMMTARQIEVWVCDMTYDFNQILIFFLFKTVSKPS